MRTFVAIEINDQKVLELISEVQSKLEIKAKPVKLSNIHFTLLFLGEVSDEIAENVKAALDSIKFSPFNVGFVGIGAFPNTSIPRVIWVGTEKQGGQKLRELASKVVEKLSPMGFQNDKPFKSHVTIFRIKNKIGDISNRLKKFESVSLGNQRVSEIKFKKSVLTSDGPIYSDLQVVKATI